MKHISINVSEEIKHILPDTLEKDLKENEDICPVCHGLGIIKRNHSYGIKEDEMPLKVNWYDNEYFVWCPNCYFGVIEKCEYCGKILPKGRLKCDCEKQREIDEEEKRIKYQEVISKAKEADMKDVGLDMWFYDEHTDDYFSDIDNFVDAYKDNEEFIDNKEMLENLPEVLWLCDNVDISMDADSIIESACEELHEDAEENITGQDRKELQELLDNWCKKQTGTTTLYPNYEKYVKVKKEWFKE